MGFPTMTAIGTKDRLGWLGDRRSGPVRVVGEVIVGEAKILNAALFGCLGFFSCG